MRRDPRVAAGPIALAATDMATLLPYFNLARRLLGWKGPSGELGVNNDGARGPNRSVNPGLVRPGPQPTSPKETSRGESCSSH
jgi:hypothetical protein